MLAKPEIPAETDLSGRSAADWFEDLGDLIEDHGSFNFLGKSYAAGFLQGGTKLIVTFESADQALGRNARGLPTGIHHLQEDGWSHLGIYAKAPGWYRHPKIYNHFDRLIDDGFFEAFDEILFYGAEGGGYAAAAYSVAAPGARVLAIRPQATLDPQITGFESRFDHGKRLDFSTRYGYAPEMIDAANHVAIAFDPMNRLDMAHAALFTKRHMQPLRCPGFGVNVEQGLNEMGIAAELRRQAMAGALSPVSFAKLWRARRINPQYLRNLLYRTNAAERPRLMASVCAHARIAGTQDRYFAITEHALKNRGVRPLFAPEPLPEKKATEGSAA